MHDYYFKHLDKEKKAKIKEKYKKEYAGSDFQKRITRLLVYSIIAIVFGLGLIIYSIIRPEELVGNLLIAIPLFIAAIIFLIGRYYDKLMILNKIALKEKN